jgi:hypothetical protein
MTRPTEKHTVEINGAIATLKMSSKYDICQSKARVAMLKRDTINVKEHFLITFFWCLLTTFGGLTLLLRFADSLGLSGDSWVFPQKYEKIGA